MKIYTVGGYVRDLLLRESGYDVPLGGDRDWVVVGATPEEMLDRGFTPVGADFPVFLHPKTHEEYALARTERKTARGYHGFIFHTDPSVTLEEDLKRRDLTINAMALNDEGRIIDPYGGMNDLRNRILRHVSEAFSEDPVRILRVARFCAKFGDFQIAEETMKLMRLMVQNGEADALVPERIWSEISRGLASRHPLNMIDALDCCGLWAKLFPVDPKNPAMREALSKAAEENLSLDARFALMTSFCSTPEEAQKLAASLRAPVVLQQLCGCFLTLLPLFEKAEDVQSAGALLERGDALRRPERMLTMIHMWETLSQKPAANLKKATELWRSVDAGTVAKAQAVPRQIPAAVRAARMEAIRPLFAISEKTSDHGHDGCQ